MRSKAQLSKIDQLHQTGQQLAVLKRMYESYILLIDRILSRQRFLNTTPSNVEEAQPQTSTPVQIGQKADAQDLGLLTEDGGQAFAVPLTPKATVRFERLRDRIKMYALSEIEHCLEEKESLVFLVSAPICGCYS